MRCPKCKFETERRSCPNCGADLSPNYTAAAASRRLYNEALLRAQSDDLSGAMEFLNRSLSFDKYNLEARNLLGLVYGAYGRLGEALRQWVISYNYKTADNEANEYIESIRKNYRNMEKLNESVRLYNKALESLRQHSDDIAIIQLKKAVDINPEFVDALNLLTICYIMGGQERNALSTARRVLDIDAGNREALRYIGEINPELKKRGARTRPDQAETKAAESKPAQKQRPRIQPSFADAGAGGRFRLGISHLVLFIAGVLAAMFVYSAYIIPPSLEVKQKEIDRLEGEMRANNETMTRQLDEKTGENEELKSANEKQNQLIVSLNQEIDRQQRIQKLNYAKNLLLEGKLDEAVENAVPVDLTDLPAEYADIVLEIKDAAYPQLELKYYNSGISEYNKSNFAEAKLAFEKSTSFAGADSTRIDDCIYYIGRCSEVLEDLKTARECYERIINDYPASNMLANAKNRLRNLPS